MSTTEDPTGVAQEIGGWVSGACGPGTHLQDLLARREKGELVSLDLLFLQSQVFDVAGQLGVRMSDGNSTTVLTIGPAVSGPAEVATAIRNAERVAEMLMSYVSMMRVRRGDRQVFQALGDAVPDMPRRVEPPMNAGGL